MLFLFRLFFIFHQIPYDVIRLVKGAKPLRVGDPVPSPPSSVRGNDAVMSPSQSLPSSIKEDGEYADISMVSIPPARPLTFYQISEYSKIILSEYSKWNFDQDEISEISVFHSFAIIRQTPILKQVSFFIFITIRSFS